MGFKGILVALDTAPPARGRVELAAALAERFDAHLIGLYTTLPVEAPPRRGYFDYFDRSLLAPLYPRCIPPRSPRCTAAMLI